MPNRVYQNFEELRQDVNSLIDSGRVLVHHHARESHSEFSDVERIAVVRYGGQPKADRSRPAKDGVYVCWGRLEGHGLCRGVFCVEETDTAAQVLVITVFHQP
jgi:hypothetical protein